MQGKRSKGTERTQIVRWQKRSVVSVIMSNMNEIKQSNQKTETVRLNFKNSMSVVHKRYI